MLIINNREVDKITKKQIKIENSKENSKNGFSLLIIVNFLIDNTEGYFTLRFGFVEKNSDSLFNREYIGNFFGSVGENIVLEIFDTKQFIASEIESPITINLKNNDNKIKTKIYVDDKYLKLIFDDELDFINS